jgi:hypothetical protein
MHRSSSNPWTYVESLIGGYRSRHLFEHVKAYVMFIGHPRSGSTLVSSLLNAHRNVCVANELNALRYVGRGYGRQQLFWLLRRKDLDFTRRGLTWTGYDYAVPNQWQGRFERLLVVGDKKAGVSTDMLGISPHLFERLERTLQVPIRVVHLLRNPFNVITSMYRREKRTTLRIAIERFFERCRVNGELMQHHLSRVHTIKLEELIASPQEELKSLCEFVGLSADLSYLDDCASILFEKPRQSRQDVCWPPELIDSVCDGIDRYSFLHGYAEHGESASSRDQAA